MNLLAEPGELTSFSGQDVDPVRELLLLQLATAAVVNAAEVPLFHVEDDVVVLDGNGARSLLLPAWPVTNVATIEVNGTDASGWSWSRTGELRAAGTWPAGLRSITVTYSHGYLNEDMPAEMKAVCLQSADRALANPGRLQSFSDSQVSAVFGGSGTGAQVIELYRTEIEMVRRALR